MVTGDIAKSLGVSPQSRMVNGYSGRSVSLTTISEVWNWRVLHPEMVRRELALFFSDPRTVRLGFDAQGLAILVTPIGNGSSGRTAGAEAIANFWTRNSRTYLAGRPSRMTPEGMAWLKEGYAPIAYPGTSNHEEDTYESRGMATDAVGWENGWMGANAFLFGLKTFWNVGSEPWHLQPDGYRNTKSQLQSDLRAWGLPVITLPKIPLATAPVTPTPTPVEPTEEEEEMPVIVYKHPAHPEVFAIIGGDVVHCDEALRDVYLFGGAVDLRNKGTNEDVYQKLLKKSLV